LFVFASGVSLLHLRTRNLRWLLTRNLLSLLTKVSISRLSFTVVKVCYPTWIETTSPVHRLDQLLSLQAGFLPIALLFKFVAAVPVAVRFFSNQGQARKL
jgi:hypothetical protein